MKYSELMIGDWVYESERTQFPMKVVSIGEDYCYLDFPENEGDVFDGNEAVPIPLDYGILKKAGFEMENDSGDYILSRGDKNLYITEEADGFSVFPINGVKYLHELQNLLRVMYKIELEVKL